MPSKAPYRWDCPAAAPKVVKTPLGLAEPVQAVAVSQYLVNVIARQAIGGRKLCQFAGLDAEQPVAARAKPDAAGGILVDRPDLAVAELFDDGIVRECAGVKSGQSAIGSNPQVARAID